jgi:hypothetical protein
VTMTGSPRAARRTQRPVLSCSSRIVMISMCTACRFRRVRASQVRVDHSILGVTTCVLLIDGDVIKLHRPAAGAGGGTGVSVEGVGTRS